MSQLDFSESLYKYLSLQKRKLSPRKFKWLPKVMSWWGHLHHILMFLGSLPALPSSGFELFNVYWRNPWTEMNETELYCFHRIFYFEFYHAFVLLKFFLSFNIIYLFYHSIHLILNVLKYSFSNLLLTNCG